MSKRKFRKVRHRNDLPQRPSFKQLSQGVKEVSQQAVAVSLLPEETVSINQT